MHYKPGPIYSSSFWRVVRLCISGVCVIRE